MRQVVKVLALVLFAFGAAAQPTDTATTFVVHVDREGALSVAGETAPLDDASIVSQAAAALQRDSDTVLVVEGDSGAPYRDVVRAAQLLQQSGATKISFRTVAGE
jgi:biopolymer transport protein ExbD